MKKEQDGFILLDLESFTKWLSEQSINRNVVRIQNHHTWKPDYSNFKDDNHMSLLKNMKHYHVSHNGWSDIAQNITTFPDGTIAICRSLEKTPVGIKGANTGAICIEHIGNFDTGKDEMTEAHKNTIIQLNALLCGAFCLEPNSDSIVYHHWWDLSTGKRTNGSGSTKTCPGTNFFGGNSVESAEDIFIPLIKEVYDALDLKAFGIITASALNLRSGPGTSYPVIGKVYKEQKVRIYEKTDEWCRVNETEWACLKYINMQ